MASMKAHTYAVAVIGDIVDSRSHDRTALHRALTTALAALSEHGIEPLHPTVGDEIQGIFATHGEALRPAHLLRLRLRESDYDIRFGIGAGEIRIVDRESGIQDGPAWWAARDALNHTEELASTPGWAGVRTGLGLSTTHKEGSDASHATVGTSPSHEPHAPQITALCHLIDAHISALNPSTCVTLRGLLEGESNVETAERLSISPSANTQRVNRHALRPLAEAIRATWS
ncbi:SatD family protein [Dermabacter sp. HSID17554]|uniref:SatD family protein n=1 Tax=Dermabacter sp. HSID17554 TaxID=2419511 RepID=UPI000F86315D|nr:SatD family protein [Dermabacter sp. HSID17554]RUP87487.1 RNA polymerase subunit sigma-70 [Dermabacter sp. HSID17554]